MTTCAEIMTEKIKFHLPTTPVDLIAKTMKDSNVGPVPIVDSKSSMRLVGIVTDRDLAVKVVAEDKDSKSTDASDVMSPDPITCTPEDKIDRAIQLMEECQVRRIPVVDKDGRLVGIIAQADIATRLNKAKKTAEVVEEISKTPVKRPHNIQKM